MHFPGSFMQFRFPSLNFLLACFAARVAFKRTDTSTYTAPADERATRLRLAQFHSAKRNEM